MNRFLSVAVALCLIAPASIACFADVQYTEQSKITGGAVAGAMKFAGVFSKDAKQATQGSTTTISVKGNRMRRETSLGTAEIYDLDGRRIIDLDLKHKTYSIMTFDDLRRQMEEARRKAAEQQAKSHNGSEEQVKITPKIQVTPGSGSKQILDHTAKEVKTRIDIQMESQDPQHGNQSGNMWVNADTYVAPVKAYEDVRRFYVKMAKELNWVPGEVFSGNVQISQPMIEYRKSLANMTGMPLLSYVSVGAGPNPGTTGQNAPEKKDSGNVVKKGLSGMFGGLGKKKKDDSGQQQSGSTSGSGSMMDMTTEVTSITPGAVDASLFEVPAGFKQLEPKKNAQTH